MGIRWKHRKLKPKYAKSVKKNAAKTQAWDEGYRYGFNCYKPNRTYRDHKLQTQFDNGFYAGLNGEKR